MKKGILIVFLHNIFWQCSSFYLDKNIEMFEKITDIRNISNIISWDLLCFFVFALLWIFTGGLLVCAFSECAKQKIVKNNDTDDVLQT